MHSLDLKADSNEVISHNTKAKRLGSEISRKSASGELGGNQGDQKEAQLPGEAEGYGRRCGSSG